MTAYIGIGGNLGDRADTLRKAVAVLDGEDEVRMVAVSGVYETAPIGVTDQPSFLNAVLQVETSLSGPALLNRLLEIERQFGRYRKKKWGPRTLDLDILLYGEEVIQVPGLQVPHPYLHERAFVLVPLCELLPCGRHPVLGKQFTDFLAQLDSDQGVRRVGGLSLWAHQ
ncbi:MAG: 2-amino-4-hydroxy-6-hydroxymethyldihydropteridine diphosphokinase [bacterium]|nr:2-amino-4-hydroxy-6-hydroxymethyldihydropteridine diphosphokinase [bacterium]